MFDARPAWHDQAACTDADPMLFFPTTGEDSKPAKAICARCPVRTTCLEHALDQGERFGIWGGTSERERRRLRGPRQPAAHGTRSGYQAHRQKGDEPCEDCRAANTEYHRRRIA